MIRSLISSKKNYERIISLVPSQTELLYDLGLGDKVVGITKFCIHPKEWFRIKTRIGGTKNIHFSIIEGLRPDLIIANKEENVKEQIEQLAQKFDVMVTDVNNLDEALNMISEIGLVTDTNEKAAKIVELISSAFNSIPIESFSFKKAAYLIWKDPYMAAGNNTFIHDMLPYCGLKNVLAHTSRYPEITLEQLKQLKVEVVLLSSEPYPFKEKHIKEIQSVLPEVNILLVDGEMFSWYGSRLLQAPAYFRTVMINAHKS